MVRNYKRKTEQGRYGTDALKRALDAIKDGASIRTVSRSFGIPRKTLSRHMQGLVTAPGKLGRYRPVLDEAYELELVNHILSMQQMFYGLSTGNIRKLAFDLAEKRGVNHSFNKDKGKAGEDWLAGFLKRHPELSLRKPEATSLTRAVGFNKPAVDKFYQLLKGEIAAHGFKENSIWNMDETGITVVHKSGQILARKGQKQVGKITSGERGKTVTVVCCVNAAGTYTPPMMVFPRKRMAPNLMKGAPAGAIGRCSDNGWINQDLFLEWLRHFTEYAQPSSEKPCLLLLDGHNSHKTLEAVTYAKENHITMLVLPPHTTHRLQPLDCTYFGPLKSSFHQEADRWMLMNPGMRISVFEMAQLFGDAYRKTSTMLKATNGYRCTEIWPYNPDVFTEADFMPSRLTEEPAPEPAPEQAPEPAPEVQREEDQAMANQSLPVIEETVPVVHATVTDTHVAEISEEPAAQQVLVVADIHVHTHADEDDGVTECVSGTTSVPLDADDIRDEIRTFSPLPKAKQQRVRKRKVMSSEVVTASPFKKRLEEEKNLKKKSTQRQRRTKGTKKVSCTTSRNKDQDTFCLYCNEKYTHPPNEDWLECITCKMWYHAECGDEKDVCDLCN